MATNKLRHIDMSTNTCIGSEQKNVSVTISTREYVMPDSIKV